MPEILVLPSPATRRTYPLHLRIVCALVAKLADLQISMQHAHTARLVRNFPARYSPVERMQVQRTGDQIKVVDILSPIEQDFERMRAEVAQLLEDALGKSPHQGMYGYTPETQRRLDELSGTEVPRKENPDA